MADATGSGTREDPWVLKTPPGGSSYEAYRDPEADPPALVVQVAKTELRYHLRAIDDLHAMLADHGDWMPLGSADEGKPAAAGTVEAWARADDNPVAGWYEVDPTPASARGVHSYDIGPNARYALHSYSSWGVPPVTELVRLPAHQTVRPLVDRVVGAADVSRSPHQVSRADLRRPPQPPPVIAAR